MRSIAETARTALEKAVGAAECEQSEEALCRIEKALSLWPQGHFQAVRQARDAAFRRHARALVTMAEQQTGSAGRERLVWQAAESITQLADRRPSPGYLKNMMLGHFGHSRLVRHVFGTGSEPPLSPPLQPQPDAPAQGEAAGDAGRTPPSPAAPSLAARLPGVLWQELCGFLDAPGLCALSRCSRRLKGVAEGDSVWWGLVSGRWGSTLCTAVHWPAALFGSTRLVVPPGKVAYKRLQACVGQKTPIALDIGSGYARAGSALSRLPTGGQLSAVFGVLHRECGFLNTVDLNCICTCEGINSVSWLYRCGVAIPVSPRERELLEAGLRSLAMAPSDPLAVVVSDSSRQRSSPDGNNAAPPPGMWRRDAGANHFNDKCFHVESPILAALAAGRHTALVLDAGFAVTRAAAVVEGRIAESSRRWAPIGGSVVTNILAEVLMPNLPSGVVDVMMLKALKETLCNINNDCTSADVNITIADGDFSIPAADTRRPVEALFDFRKVRREHLFDSSDPLQCAQLEYVQAGGWGMQHIVADSAARAAPRGSALFKELVSNVVIAGGSCSFPGFADELERQLALILSPDTPPHVLRLDSLPDNTTWTGGAVAALAAVACDAMPEPDDEQGPSVEHLNVRGGSEDVLPLYEVEDEEEPELDY
eukprot:Hpha_TRINITY_DN15756_c4_g1::TRINITY_DN15756_c4_g1_i1::g.39917::m.39917